MWSDFFNLIIRGIICALVFCFGCSRNNPADYLKIDKLNLLDLEYKIEKFETDKHIFMNDISVEFILKFDKYDMKRLIETSELVNFQSLPVKNWKNLPLRYEQNLKSRGFFYLSDELSSEYKLIIIDSIKNQIIYVYEKV